MMEGRSQESRYLPPAVVPTQPREPAIETDNPIAALHAQITTFLASRTASARARVDPL